MQTVVARYRESRRRATYLHIFDFAQHECYSVRAPAISSQPGRLEKLLRRLRLPAHFKFSCDDGSLSTLPMPSIRVPDDAVETVNSLPPTSMAPEYDQDPSGSLTTSKRTDPTLALSPNTIPAPERRYADRKAQFTRSE